MDGFLLEVIVVLLAALAATTVFQRLGLGAVLGYLVAGAAAGPHGLGLIGEGVAIEALGELGVVFLLFSVGLELPLERVRTMRAQIFGLGAAQVLVSAVAIALVARLIGADWEAALIIGFALALSSTAIVLRLLSERGEITSRFGRSAVAILLMQDLAVGPLLVAVAALGPEVGSTAGALGIAAIKVTLALALILGFGRVTLRFAYFPIAATRNPETFTALTLLVVLGVGLLAHMAGLSMAFGGFLAGMLLAETHYRHQVAADIRAFRGLLLGLFFITVGMSIDLAIAIRDAPLLLLLAAGLMAGKAAILFLLARVSRLPTGEALRIGLLLAQGGEFAFVLLGVAMTATVIPQELGQRLTLVVSLTMMATPVLAAVGQRLAVRMQRAAVPHARAVAPASPPPAGAVIIAGFGRVGEAVAARLTEAGVSCVAVDLDPARVALARSKGYRVYYGDASLPDVLDAVGVSSARAIVISLDDAKAASQVVALLRYVFPALKIFARAYDEEHAAYLKTHGADEVVAEVNPTSQRLAKSLLETLKDD